MSSLRFIKNRLRLLRRSGAPGQPLHDWGFVVYRTVYPNDGDKDTEQEALWQTLVGTITSKVRASILPRPSHRDDPPDEEYVAACEELAAHFRLEIKDDKAELEGKSMREIREIAKAENAARAAVVGTVDDDDYDDADKAALRRHAYLYHKSYVFLYVDEQVLMQFGKDSQGGPNTPWIKVVEVDYEPELHRGNARFGPQHYFGAMAAEVAELNYLWTDLERDNVAVIAPRWVSSGDGAGGHSNEGVVAVWDSAGAMMDDGLKLRARVVDDVLEFV